MKKKSGLDKALDVISFSELQSLSTGALLARLKRLRWCIEDPADASEFEHDELESVQDKIVFKSDPKWKQAYKDVKAILDTREHKPNMS